MIIIKIGGNAISKLDNAFFDQMRTWLAQHEQVVIVHGGGQMITSASEFFNFPTKKIDGIRVTPKRLITLTAQILDQVVQPMFAQRFKDHGIPCYALNQNQESILYGDYLDQAKYGEVGKITGVNKQALANLPQGKVTIMSSLAIDDQGHTLNVNADTAAQSLATLTNAEELILLTDVPGVLIDQVIVDRINPQKAAEMIDAQQITAGMVPKIKSAFTALNAGVAKITITNHLDHAGTEIML
ncbi:acetylglutamate kinase [Leuconostocaceae bacterium ESL0723]|nr:acetylglutamate kinase [Leuconostocaceae bacterium ESL0723]